MLEVRKTRPEEYQTFNELYTNLDYSSSIIGEKEKDPYSFYSRASQEVTVELSEEEFLNMLKEELVYSFFENGEFVGYAEVIPNKRKWYIQEFGIKKEKQHQGLGKAFFKKILKKAKKKKISVMKLSCHSKGSIVFWEKQGFSHKKGTIMRKGL